MMIVIKLALWGVRRYLITCGFTWSMLPIADIKSLHLETGRARRAVIIFRIEEISKIFHDSCFSGAIIVLIFNVL